jgi:hypothetical protein
VRARTDQIDLQTNVVSLSFWSIRAAKARAFWS